VTDAKFKAMRDEIERLMDSHHISTFLEACGQVLAEKAEHVAGNWQDNVTANQLQAAANAVTDAAGYVD
jgi:hypothetical protein